MNWKKTLVIILMSLLILSYPDRISLASENTSNTEGKHKVSLINQQNAEETIKVIVELENTSGSSFGKKKAKGNSQSQHIKIQNAIRNMTKNDENTSSESLGGYRIQSNEGGQNIENNENMTVLYDYYQIIDGFAIEIKRKYLSEIKELNGVKTAFEAQTVHPLENDLQNENGTTTQEETVSFQNADSLKAIGADNSAYTGKGQLVAVLDTGLSTDHEAFQGDVDNPVLSQSDINAKLSQMTLRDRGLSGSSLYISNKIPFAYDYAGKDANVNPGSISDISHGTHVAGIVAANSGGIVKGVAPDAQLLIMKTFTDAGSGDDTYILAAAEDAVVLGADVINMSLGSDAGFDSAREEVYTRVYNNIQSRGIFLSAAAGNSYAATYNTGNGNDYAAAGNPDYGILVDPSTYQAAMSVASSDSSSQELYFISSDHSRIVYEEADGSQRPRLNSLKGTWQYIDCGYGTSKDIQNAMMEAGTDSLSGMIALIRRGKSETAPEEEETLTFSEKISQAASQGASAVIISDNTEKNTLTVMSGISQTRIPSVFISKADGDSLTAASKKTIVIDEDYKQGAPARLSSFSSWGVTPEMKLKPEITAPGGNIYSTIPDNKYGYKSGTSMATPAIAGLALDAREYIASDEKFAGFSDSEKNELVPLLLMNTAVPVPYGKDSWYSPRKQGAGLANLAALTQAKAYLTVQGAELSRPKAELGDGEGPYTATFTIHNLTAEPLHYEINTAALSEVIKKGYFQQYSKDYAGKGIRIDYSGVTGKGVEVPASGEVRVSVTLTPEDAFLSDIASALNGTFIDGYVMLTADAGSGSDLSFPFLAFYGNWGDAPVMDGVLHEGNDSSVFMRGCEPYSPSSYNYNLGDNNFDGNIDLDPRHYAFSKNSKGGVFASISTITGLLRPASEMHYVMKLKSTGEIVNQYDYHDVRRSYYAPEAGMVTYAETFLADQGGAPVFGTTTKNNKELTDGVYTIEVTAKSCGPHARNSSWSFDVTYDTEKPRLDSSEITGSEGEQTLHLHLSDNHYVSAIKLVYGKNDTALETKTFDFEDERKDNRACYEVTFDYEDIISNLKGHTDESPESIKVLLYDYAMNETTETVPLKDIYPESIHLNTDSLKLIQGQEAKLSADLLPENVTRKKIRWTSSDESIVKVDEYGTVTALEKGKVSITAETEAKDVMASCDITVTELTDEMGIILNKRELSLIMETTKQLTVFISPSFKDTTVVWNSANPEVAAVDENGLIRAVSTGTTKVTASLSSGDTVFSDTCQVTVKPKPTDEFVIDDQGVLTDYVGWSTQITIPEGVTEIAAEAFSGKQITEALLPKSCRLIGKNAFANCTGLTAVRFADAKESKCTGIDEGAFDGCSRLRTFTLPAALEELGKAALRGTGIGTLDLPENITVIPDELCSGCGSLTKISASGIITWIGRQAFYHTKLKDAQPILSEGMIHIGEEAFMATSVEDFIFPDSVKETGCRILADCLYLKTVYIGKNMSSAEELTIHTPSLEAISVSADNPVLESMNQILYTKATDGKRKLLAYPAALIQKQEGAVTIRKDVAEIEKSAFWGMEGLRDLTYEDSSVLTKVGQDAFYGCTALKAVTLPDSVTVILDQAFCNCADVSALSIGSGLCEIGVDAFRGMDGLSSITVNPDNPVFISEEDVLYNKEKTELIRYAPKKMTEEYISPDSLKIIDNRAFYGADLLKSVMISEGVEQIGDEAFAGATALTSLSLPDSLVSVGEKAFTGVNAEELYLGTHLKNISQEALGNLKVRHIILEGDRVDLPYSPGLNNLETLYLGDGVSSITSTLGVSSADSIVLGSNLKEVNKNAFNQMKKGTFYIEKETATWDTMSPIIKELQKRRGSSNIKLVEYAPLSAVLKRTDNGNMVKAAAEGGVGTYEFRFLIIHADGSEMLLSDWGETEAITLTGLPEDSILKVNVRDASRHRITLTMHVSGRKLLSGDVNGDGEVNAQDLTALNLHLKQKKRITDSELLENADVNGDGKVNQEDLRLLSAYVSHII